MFDSDKRTTYYSRFSYANRPAIRQFNKNVNHRLLIQQRIARPVMPSQVRTQRIYETSSHSIGSAALEVRFLCLFVCGGCSVHTLRRQAVDRAGTRLRV